MAAKPTTRSVMVMHLGSFPRKRSRLRTYRQGPRRVAVYVAATLDAALRWCRRHNTTATHRFWIEHPYCRATLFPRQVRVARDRD